MIRINLAKKIKAAPMGATNVSTDPIETDAQDIQKQGLLRLVIIALVPLALIVYESQNIPKKKTKLRNLNNRVNELVAKNQAASSAVEQMKRFQEAEAKLAKQIETIEGLRKDRLQEVRVLDLVQKELPPKVWLSKVDLRERRLEFQGTATTDVDLTNFMEILARSPLVEEVNLVKSNEQAAGNLIVKRFEVRCKLVNLNEKAKQAQAEGGGK